MSSASIERAWTERPRDEAWWRRAVVVHAIATWFLVGMIWTIQVVHYPLFAEVGPSEYVEFQAAHVERIGPLLAVPWAVEGAATVALLLWWAVTVRRVSGGESPSA